MFSTLVSQIWSSKTGEQQLLCDTVSPGKSTCASVNGDDSDDVSTSEWRASLWSVDGTKATETVSDASIAFEGDHLVLRGRLPESDEDAGDKAMKTIKFNCLKVSHFRQHQADMFQWVLKQNSDAGEEYGLLFTTTEDACVFNKTMLPRIRGNAKSLCRVPVEFRQYERESQSWDTVEKFASLCIMQRPTDFEAFLVVEEETTSDQNAKRKVLSELGVSNEEYIFPQPSENQVVWWGHDDDAVAEGQRKMFAAYFLCGKDERERILEILRQVLHEQSEGAKVDDAGEYDDDAFEGPRQSCIKADGDVAMQWEEDEDQKKGSDNDENEKEIPVVSVDPTRQRLVESPDALLPKAMQVASDRAVVVKGNCRTGVSQLDLLKFDEYGKENVVALFNDDKLRYNGDTVSPSKSIMFHDHEKKVLTTDENDPRYVYMLDLESEKLVQKWDANCQPVQDIMPTSKNAPKTGDPTFLGFNSRAFFAMDTRQNKPTAHTRTTTYAYTSNVQFTCGATDASGHVLIGSKLGQLRLYDGQSNDEGKFKRAKTQLGGLGDPLLHVAVTSDGSWILGTCAKYLILFPVKLASSGKIGFVTALGKNKPRPIRLKLSFKDLVKYNMKDVCFSKGEFDAEEKTIVSATGSLVIVWDFEGLKKNGVPQDEEEVPYGIRTAEDFVKEAAFLDAASQGDDKEKTVVMATMKGVSSKQFVRKSV